MDLLRKRRSLSCSLDAKNPLLFLLSIFILLAMAFFLSTISSCIDSSNVAARKRKIECSCIMEQLEKVVIIRRDPWKLVKQVSNRRELRGLGSSPPRCQSKCGSCSPCSPVHVAVPPGTPVTTEYYPEAWRCKCGNRLYMP